MVELIAETLEIDAAQPTEESASEAESRRRAYIPRGAAREIMGRKDPEIILSGPSGTGKSYAILQKLYIAALKYPGMRAAILRKFRSTITQSAINTFNQRVCIPGDGVKFNTVSQEYTFPEVDGQKSRIVVAGLDDPTKILSTEFDIIYVQECTEIEEDVWEMLTTRLRWSRMPYQQILGDCNPDSERHWIKQREKENKVVLMQSWHKDNPLWWDEKEQQWTKAGQEYINTLKNMTGFMRERFYEGKWVGAEGLIFTEYDYKKNLIDPMPIPKQWRRYVSIDFGFTHPFVCQWWAEDNDGRIYLYRELYGTGTIVEDWAHKIHDLSKGEKIDAYICDHDIEDRMTLQRHLGHNESQCTGGTEKNFNRIAKSMVKTVGADKGHNSVSAGIQQIKARLVPAGDGKPRLFFLRGSLFEPDGSLQAKKKPTCTEEEISAYVWDEVTSGRLGTRTLEKPRNLDDHGMDAMRYMVRYLDGRNNTPTNAIFGQRTKRSYTGQSPTTTKPDKLSFWR